LIGGAATMQKSVAHTAGAVLIGNELLTGKVHESNLIELARTLRSLGVRLERVVIIPDTIAEIADEVRAQSEAYDVVFTSGGVGPTHDDVTIEGIAGAFGVGVKSDETMETLLRNAYGDRIKEGHLRMALVPDGAELVTTPEILWPTPVLKNVWILPGVPEIFRMKLAVVREWVRGPESFVSRAVFTKMDEADLKPLLDEIVASYSDVDVGSYPKWFDSTYKTKVTFDSQSRERVDAALDHFVQLLPKGEPQRVE
jgi:molybdenum cofactor synthesis domain-containing protein